MVTMLATVVSMEKGQKEIAGSMDGWTTTMMTGIAGDASVTGGTIEEIGMIGWSAGE
jgi:hypothetical protein